MKYFVVITLMICVIGVSSVFAAGQTKAATSNLVVTAQTVQNMAKNTVKYFVPIESILAGISFLLPSPFPWLFISMVMDIQMLFLYVIFWGELL